MCQKNQMLLKGYPYIYLIVVMHTTKWLGNHSLASTWPRVWVHKIQALTHIWLILVGDDKLFVVDAPERGTLQSPGIVNTGDHRQCWPRHVIVRSPLYADGFHISIISSRKTDCADFWTNGVGSTCPENIEYVANRLLPWHPSWRNDTSEYVAKRLLPWQLSWRNDTSEYVAKRLLPWQFGPPKPSQLQLAEVAEDLLFAFLT